MILYIQPLRHEEVSYAPIYRYKDELLFEKARFKLLSHMPPFIYVFLYLQKEVLEE